MTGRMGITQHTSGFTFHRVGIIIVFCCIAALLRAQENTVRVSGGFFSDSVKIGEQTAFYLSARYPLNLQVLFPDSTFSFHPFEFESKEYFPTRTEEGISLDSAVYFLTTFEVDPVLSLSLPVFVINEQDCTLFVSSPDSLSLIEVVAEVPDSLSAAQLPLKMNTAYHKVNFQFNTWVLLIILGVLVVAGVLVWIVFGKKIRRYFITRRLVRNHSKFLSAFNHRLTNLRSAFSIPGAESALSSWKKYMEQLESLPYTKLTTRETRALIRDETVLNNLRDIDRAIYGHETSVVEPLEKLRQVAETHFHQKLQQVRHGK